MAQTRKQPLRRCAGCGQMKEKKDLIRVIRTDTGTVEIDKTGKKNGRGVYLCRSPECLGRARKSRGLERGLKCGVPPEVYEDLGRQIGGG